MNEHKITSKNLHDIGYKTLFSDNAYLMHVHKKSHGISRAVYLITDFFDNKEPIKVRMRQLSIDLVEQVLSLSIQPSPERKSLLDNLIKTNLSLISFSEIAMFSGIESQMNHSVLCAEIQGLMSVIEERETPGRLGGHFVLDEAFFSKENKPEISTPVHPVIKKPTIHTKPITEGTDTSDKRKSERRNAILGIIKNKVNASIKDIAEGVVGCSEKTVQRELLDMVASGLLKKEGERRWSRYSLISL
ncbi:MAG: hypothetical protein WCO16_03055 [bacterium]